MKTRAGGTECGMMAFQPQLVAYDLTSKLGEHGKVVSKLMALS